MKKSLPLEAILGEKFKYLTGSITDADLARRVYLLFFISFIGIFTLIPLGILAFFENVRVLAVFDLTLAAILAANLVHARTYGRLERNIVLGIVFTMMLFIFAFVTGGKNQSAFVWYYTFPLIAAFMIGPRRGLLLSLAMLLPVLALFMFSDPPPVLASYSFDFKARFLPSYIVVVLFSYLAEHLRRKSARDLEDSYSEMEGMVRMRTAQLQEVNAELEREISEKTEAEKDLSERVRLLALTADIGRAMSGRDPLEASLRRCTDAMVKHLPAAFARIWVFHSEEEVLELFASSGMYIHLDGPHSRMRLGEGKIGTIAEDGTPVLTNSVIGDPHISDQEWAIREGIVAFAGHPMHVSGRLTGVMALFAKEPLSRSVLESLSAVADQIAIGVERKQTESRLAHSEEYLRSIVETEPECVKLMDSDGVVLDMNPSGLAMVEADLPGQVIGKSLYDLVHQEDREGVKAFTWKTAQGMGGTMEFRVVGLKGGARWLETHAVPFDDRQHARTLVLAVTRDVTERRDAEESLRRLKEDLERHNEELKKLDKMKSAFIYAVSHELKTPVSKHSMQLEILKPLMKKYDLSKMERDSIRVMEESIRRQQGVVRNLLDLSRLESGQRPYREEEVDLEELFYRVRKEYEYALESFGIDLDMRVPPIMLRTDGEMLWHVFSNLINNAIKFRSGDGKAAISIRAALQDGNVLITIRDNGVGLSMEELEKVFSRFYQATSSVEGTGVGLTICKMIVEGLGGKIRLESEGQGKGTSAVVELPVRMTTG
jgi:PAS domain S-box-containing protein